MSCVYSSHKESMMLLKIEGFEDLIIGYSYAATEQVVADKIDPDVLSALAGGFVSMVITQDVADQINSVNKLDEEQLESLQSLVGKSVICVDTDNLANWPMDQFLAMLYHEKGHLVFGHLHGKEGQEGLLVNERYELEADAYAAAVVGKKAMRKALMRAIFQCHQRTFKKGLLKTTLSTIIAMGGNQRYRFKALN